MNVMSEVTAYWFEIQGDNGIFVFITGLFRTVLRPIQLSIQWTHVILPWV